MLNDIFLSVFKMSITASAAAVILLFIKYLLQKAGFSRSIMMVLWLLIAIKLVCPVVPESQFSFFNIIDISNTYTGEAQYNIQNEKFGSDNGADKIVLKNALIKTNTKSIEKRNIMPSVWLFGAGVMLTYFLISWTKLKRKLRFAIKIDKEIYMLNQIKSSFVFGIIRPRIFVPSAADDETLENMIFHEKMHIKRLDHISKILAWLILSLHWFNPFVWLMFNMFSTDIELACDEAVIRNNKNRASYMKSLLEISLQKDKQIKNTAVCTFEACVKKRIKNLAAYQKTTALSNVISFFTCVILFLTFGTGAIKANIKEINLEKQIKSESFNLPAIKPLSIPFETDEENKKELSANGNTIQKKFEYKTNTVSDELYVGYEALEYENINISNLEANLINDGYIKSAQNSDLEKNYIKESFDSGKKIYHSNISCDKNGNISVYIALNTEAHINARIFESESGIEADGGSFVANGKNVYSFIGFDPDKTYDILITSSVGSEWKINGEYIIY